jgi:hypothetical protein
MNAVYLSGNVKRPGKYEYKPGMKVRDLIKDPTDLLDETHFEYALIKRIKLPDRGTELVPFNLARFLLEKDESYNINLKPEDHVYIFSKWFFKDKPYVTVEGEVRGQVGVPETMKDAEESKPKKYDGLSRTGLKQPLLTPEEEKLRKDSLSEAEKTKTYGMIAKIDVTEDDSKKAERQSQADKAKEVGDDLKRLGKQGYREQNQKR